jgi:hypothetical protein
MTEREIAEEVMAHDKMDKESNDEKELAKSHLLILKFDCITLTSKLSKRLLFVSTKTQLKLDAFFKVISWPKPVSPQPNTSSANGVNLSRTGNKRGIGAK